MRITTSPALSCKVLRGLVVSGMKSLKAFALFFVLTVLPVSAQIGPDGTGVVNGYQIGPGADLRFANLGGADLSGANLNGADLRFANLIGADLSGADLSGVLSGNITGIPSSFPAGWIMAKGYLVGPGANLTEANLFGADLSNADLSGANLSGARLFGANLSNADLSGANLEHAGLRDARLIGANLSNANLSRANLSNAILFRANLSRADLSDADLLNANLIGAIWNTPDPRIAELETQLAAAIAERDERPTVEQMQDARVGSIVVEKDWQSGQVSLSLCLENTEDGVTWTAYEGGTWTETAGGKFTLSFPLTETKNWVRLALKE